MPFGEVERFDVINERNADMALCRISWRERPTSLHTVYTLPASARAALARATCYPDTRCAPPSPTLLCKLPQSRCSASKAAIR